MADKTHSITTRNWLNLNPEVEHFDPFEGLASGLEGDEELRPVRYGFRVAGQNILIDKAVICEILPNPYIYPLPNLPGWVQGMLNVRGNLIPVINLGQLLLQGEEEYVTAKKPLLVIDRGENAMAIFLDHLPVSLDFDESNAEESPVDEKASHLIREHTRVAYQIEGYTWHEIDHEALFKMITRGFNGSVDKEEMTEEESFT